MDVGETPETALLAMPPKNPQRELRLWDETFRKAVETMSSVVPYPAKYIRTGDDARAALLEMIQKITEVAVNFKNMEKQDSAESSECTGRKRCKVEKKKPRVDKMTDVTRHMDRLEELIVQGIHDQREVLNSPCFVRNTSH